MALRVPVPAYEASECSLMKPTRALYTKIAEPPRELVASLTVPIRAGRAWVVRQGQDCRLNTLYGPQVGHLNIWTLHNP